MYCKLRCVLHVEAFSEFSEELQVSDCEDGLTCGQKADMMVDEEARRRTIVVRDAASQVDVDAQAIKALPRMQ
jgi:hypothetical protein